MRSNGLNPVEKDSRLALAKLEDRAFAAKLQKYPNVPAHAMAKTKFTDQNTNGLTTAVLEKFKLEGIWATRIDSKGTFNQALGKFIPSRQKKGLPDVFALLPGGRACWVEIKCEATGDRLRPDQEKAIRELKETGALVFIARNFSEFDQWIESILNKAN